MRSNDEEEKLSSVSRVLTLRTKLESMKGSATQVMSIAVEPQISNKTCKVLTHSRAPQTAVSANEKKRQRKKKDTHRPRMT
jgi:hypothetical protein